MVTFLNRAAHVPLSHDLLVEYIIRGVAIIRHLRLPDRITNNKIILKTKMMANKTTAMAEARPKR